MIGYGISFASLKKVLVQRGPVFTLLVLLLFVVLLGGSGRGEQCEDDAEEEGRISAV